MSAMDDIHTALPPRDVSPGASRAVRNVLLSTAIVLLTVLSLQALDRSRDENGAVAPAAQPAEIDWKGNSGGPVRGPY